MICWIRRIVGAVLFAWSTWAILWPLVRRQTADPPIRYRPLTRSETKAAQALERVLADQPLTSPATLIDI